MTSNLQKIKKARITCINTGNGRSSSEPTVIRCLDDVSEAGELPAGCAWETVPGFTWPRF
jgi:hypothetical protein